jgi:hypothetical protein
MSASGAHNTPEFKHAEDMEWEMGRFVNVTKFLFHPRPERPTEPNAGFLKYAAAQDISGSRSTPGGCLDLLAAASRFSSAAPSRSKLRTRSTSRSG